MSDIDKADNGTVTFRGVPIYSQRFDDPPPIYVVRDRAAAERLCDGVGFELQEDSDE